jgi:hypothetical protein
MMNPDFTRIVKVGNIQLPIKYSNKALLNYLNRLSTDSEGIDSLYHYFFDLAVNAVRPKEFEYSFETFEDLVDSTPDAVTNFQVAVSSFTEQKTKKK